MIPGWVLHKFEVGHCTLEDLDGGIDFLCDWLEDDHISEEGGELSIKLHVIVTDNIEHANHQLNSLNIEDTFAFQYWK